MLFKYKGPDRLELSGPSSPNTEMTGMSILAQASGNSRSRCSTEHIRHRFILTREAALMKRTGTGNWSGWWGIYQFRRCIYCKCTDGRWKRGLTEASKHEANAVNRLTEAERAREWKLAQLEREHDAGKTL